jgi:gluconolactonase
VQGELSRRGLIASGAAAFAAPALGQPARQAPYTGPQIAAPAAPLGPPYPVVGTIEQFDPALAELIDVATPVEKILGGFVWVEGPVWIGGDDGYLLCSDTRANRIVKWRAPADGGRTAGETWISPSGYEGPDGQGWAPHLAEPGTNGLIEARGGLVAADHGNRSIAFFDLATRAKTRIVSHFEGKRFNSPNDLVLHPSGAIFFTDPPWGLLNVFNSPDREMDYTGVFRLNPDNSVTLIDRSLRPNGIGLSPDGSKLYVTDSSGWVVFDVGARAEASNRRIFVERSAMAGGDSLKIDHLGNMWTSARDGLAIFSPQGRPLGMIRADERISNCAFGADGHVYIASNSRVIRAKVKVRKIAPSTT